MLTGHCSQGFHDGCPAPLACSCTCHPHVADPVMRAGAVLPSCEEWIAPSGFTFNDLPTRVEAPTRRAPRRRRSRRPYVARPDARYRSPNRGPFPTELAADLAEWART